MFEEFVAYGAVVAAIAHLGRGLFTATFMPALARLWPQRLLRRRIALPNGAGRPADVHPCTGCRGCAGQRQQPLNQVVPHPPQRRSGPLNETVRRPDDAAAFAGSRR